MTIYGIKTCDTCRKALKSLPGAEFRDVRAMPLTAEERARFLGVFGESLINRASTTWRGLPETERTNSAEALLAAHPTLMKRPVIQKGDTLYLGWKTDVQKSLGLI
ncbi:MAG: arsenate reductase [Rhodobacteraceae bacterium]|nr:MAG: arsenate reductase [Paracoccaceae bacterium]